MSAATQTPNDDNSFYQPTGRHVTGLHTANRTRGPEERPTPASKPARGMRGALLASRCCRGPPQHSHSPRVELVKALLAKSLLRSQLRARHARVARRAATSAKPAPASNPQHLYLAYTAAGHADTMVCPMEACAVAGRQGSLRLRARSPRASALATGRHTHRRHQAPGSAELTAGSYASAPPPPLSC